MRMMWTDEYLQWDPDDYGGLTLTTVRPSDIWTPDVSLYENAQKDFVSIVDTYVLVNSNGSLDWYFPAYVIAACTIDITFFPYDVQMCNLSFGPWTLMKSMVDFRLSLQGDTTLDLFNRNGVWILEKSQGFNVDKALCCDNRTWSIVTFQLTVRRESQFYTRTVVVPSVLLTALMALVCWLHPASGEKVTLAVSNLLALILFQQLVADRMPPSGESTSIIVSFFVLMIAMCCVEVVCSIIVLRVYHTGGERAIPPFLRRLMLSSHVLPLYASPECKKMLLSEHRKLTTNRWKGLQSTPCKIKTKNQVKIMNISCMVPALARRKGRLD
ncbi:neuronal acetylcholine receptor subunit alpha-10-like [Diadema antillarum]|uniref:neuronal acetylcholine receptor subunit alpha-10-like n=1 Tax=Diadema antillarum TaxID=105358 RepID=UPI003A8741E2